MNLLIILAVGLVAGTISGIVGTGSSIMLMPVLVYQYGPKQAVPIMAIAAVMANLSRILAWWREVDWRACAAPSNKTPAQVISHFVIIAFPPIFSVLTKTMRTAGSRLGLLAARHEIRASGRVFARHREPTAEHSF